MSQILDTLYLGSYADAKNETFLKKTNITHILTVGVELTTEYPDKFKYLFIPAYDSPSYNLSTSFDQITEFIHNAIEKEKGKVLVHCYMGISRSTTSVLAYLMKHHDMNLEKARRFVKAKRSIVWPNEGFLRQLDAYSKVLTQSKGNPLSKSLAYLDPTVARLYPGSTGKENMLHSKSPSMSALRSAMPGETKSQNKDYHCKTCALRVFSTPDVQHGADRTVKSMCTALYVRYLPWMGTLKSNMGKLFCPNTKCNAVIGFTNRSGGKCQCGKHMEKIYAIYLGNVVSAKAKGS
jgi:protein-tyrosine phosphatase